MTDLAWSLVATAAGTAVGLAVGGYITYRVAKDYYQKASNDLEREADELRHYMGIALRVLQALSAGYSFVINWDHERNRPTSVNYTVGIDTGSTGEVSVEGAQPRSATGGDQEGAEPRSWWRRVFGA